MSWIESHQELSTHPKLFRLSALSGYDQDICIAKLHRLWWFALSYAEDGDLSRFSNAEIGYGVGISDKTRAEQFVSSLKEARWIDADTCFVHDWLDYAGLYLIKKYSSGYPQKLKEIWSKHGYVYGKGQGKGVKVLKKKKVALVVAQANSNYSPKRDNLTNLTNHTLPTKPTKDIYGEFGNVRLTSEELQKLKDLFGEAGTNEMIENLSQYIASKGKKYSSHYATILSWERKNAAAGTGRGNFGKGEGQNAKCTKYDGLGTTVETD